MICILKCTSHRVFVIICLNPSQPRRIAPYDTLSSPEASCRHQRWLLLYWPGQSIWNTRAHLWIPDCIVFWMETTGALEAYGITFDITDESNPVLIARPIHKFFNLFENPFTESIDYAAIEYVLNKEDGSLISFYWLLPTKSMMICMCLHPNKNVNN